MYMKGDATDAPEQSYLPSLLAVSELPGDGGRLISGRWIYICKRKISCGTYHIVHVYSCMLFLALDGYSPRGYRL